jgi:hypothetical protein
MATEGGHETHGDNNGKNDKPPLAQILAICVGLWLGLGLVAVFFLGWVVGISIVGLGLGSTLILIDIGSTRRRGHSGQ